MRRYYVSLAVTILLFLPAACRPAALSSVTATVPATTTLSAASMLTLQPATATVTHTPTMLPSATPWPTETPHPTMPPPIVAPTPEPTLSVYEDVEIYAYIISETEFQSGADEGRLPSYPLNATYSATDDTLATELKTLIEGDIFVLLTGDYYPASDGGGHLNVEKFEYVHQLYTPETPFDADFQSPQFNFSFRYPSGWFVETQPEKNGGLLVHINNAPFEASLLRPGREAYDPIAYHVSLHFELMTVAAYIGNQQEAAKAEESEDWLTTVDIAYLGMGNHTVAQVTHTSWYRSVTYAVPWADGIVIITPSLGSGSQNDVDFIRRLVASIR